MSASTVTSAPQTRPGLRTPGLVAGAVGLLVALVSTALDTPYKPAGSGTWALSQGVPLAEIVVVSAIAILSAAVVFAVAVRAAMRGTPGRAGMWSLVLALLGLPTGVVAFWTGLPAVLGIGAVVLGLHARRAAGRLPVTAAIGAGLGALVVLAALLLAFTG
jgi:hypothetical protein